MIKMNEYIKYSSILRLNHFPEYILLGSVLIHNFMHMKVKFAKDIRMLDRANNYMLKIFL